MKALVYTGPNQLVFRDEPSPVPEPGELLIRVEAVGICGSDTHAACGRHPFIDLPYRPGHEVIGIVDAVGAGVEDSWLGTRVVVEPNLACGHCTQCKAGRYNICRELLAPKAVGLVLTAYSIRASFYSIHELMRETMRGKGGLVESGELVIREAGLDGKTPGRALSTSLFRRWVPKGAMISATMARAGSARSRRSPASPIRSSRISRRCH